MVVVLAEVLAGRLQVDEERDVLAVFLPVPDRELDAEVARYTDMLLRGAPEALAITKRLVREVPLMPFDEGLRRMAELSAERFASAEAREGISAFREKRPAAWVPR